MARTSAAPTPRPRGGWIGAGDALTRYSTRRFPATRYVPGTGPHPGRDASAPGSAGPEDAVLPASPESWRQCEDYRYAIDLFNHGYWWECHEMLEGLWRAAGRGSRQGRFLQGLIQLAAAQLKWFAGRRPVADRLALRALEKLRGVPDPYMGVAIDDLLRAVRARVEGEREDPIRIRLDL